MNIGKRELYRRVSKDCGVKMDDVKLIVNSIFDIIRQSVSLGDKVSIMEFGTFAPKAYGPRKYYDVVEGEHKEMEGRVVPKFTPCKGFKDDCKE